MMGICMLFPLMSNESIIRGLLIAHRFKMPFQGLSSIFSNWWKCPRRTTCSQLTRTSERFLPPPPQCERQQPRLAAPKSTPKAMSGCELTITTGKGDTPVKLTRMRFICACILIGKKTCLSFSTRIMPTPAGVLGEVNQLVLRKKEFTYEGFSICRI